MPCSWLSQRSCVCLSSLTLWIKPSPPPLITAEWWRLGWLLSLTHQQWEFFHVSLDAVLPLLRLVWEEESCCNGLTTIASPLNWKTLQGRHREGVTELNILENATVAMGWVSPWQNFDLFFCLFGFPLTKRLSKLCSKICVRSWLGKDLFVPSVLFIQEMKIYLLTELEERDNCLRETSSGSFSTLLSKVIALSKVF